MLAVDIGNTFTRIAAFGGGDIRWRRAFPSRALDLYELEAAFREGAAEAAVPAVWIASVSPGANAVAASAAERVGLPRTVIKAGVDAVMPHALSTPATTGVDRLLSALAAGRRHFAGDAGRRGYVVAQCGSAATIDHVDADGVFRGGYIIPGPSFWLAGLAEAALLPDLSAERPDWQRLRPGDNTRDALLNGMHLCLPTAVATAAMMVEEPPLPLALTGGWAEAVAPYVNGPFVQDPDLVLHGIRLYAERSL